MTKERSEAERAAAMEAVFRVRAVESPPGPGGRRTVWHRPRSGAELVTELDGDGRVTRQELWLFGDVLTWMAGVFRTGSLPVAETDVRAPRLLEAVRWDDAPSATRVERISRVLSTYRGTDRLICHVRDVLGVKEAPRPSTNEQATDPVLEEAARREGIRRDAGRRSLGVLGAIAGGLITALGALLLWRSCGT